MNGELAHYISTKLWGQGVYFLGSPFLERLLSLGSSPLYLVTQGNALFAKRELFIIVIIIIMPQCLLESYATQLLLAFPRVTGTNLPTFRLHFELFGQFIHVKNVVNYD